MPEFSNEPNNHESNPPAGLMILIYAVIIAGYYLMYVATNTPSVF